jgi:hypothetical protein
MQLISSITVGAGGSTSMTFSAIPQTYTDLQLVVSSRSQGGGFNPTLNLEINADTSVSYVSRDLVGNGSAVGSNTRNSLAYFFIGAHSGASSTANSFGSTTVLLPNYTGSANKTISCESVSEHNDPVAFQYIIAGTFPKTTAITSLRVFDPGGGGFVQHSMASLYGILKGSGGATVTSA